jgi:6-phosphogluconate dehydrogenase
MDADIAVIGLAVMGQNLILNMNDHGFTVVAYNRTVSKVDDFLNKEARGTRVLGAHSLGEMVNLLKKPRRVMLMVKAGQAVDEFIEQLLALLEPGDIIIDGGNSLYQDTMRRTAYVESKGLLYVGTGVSGGEEGARRGPSIMPGGSQAAWAHVQPIFQAVAAKVEDGKPCCDWVGENGAGHYVKMVHNGIEYGLMAAYAEGLNVLAKAGVGSASHTADAETAPLDHPEYYQYDIDLAAVTEVWRRGSVVASWLLDLTAQALLDDPELAQYGGHVSDSGEGRWTIHAAIDEGVPVPVLSAALFQRFSSRGRSDVADKVLSAMRAGFGGHTERKESTR